MLFYLGFFYRNQEVCLLNFIINIKVFQIIQIQIIKFTQTIKPLG